jgi:hypothetical protein
VAHGYRDDFTGISQPFVQLLIPVFLIVIPGVLNNRLNGGGKITNKNIFLSH